MVARVNLSMQWCICVILVFEIWFFVSIVVQEVEKILTNLSFGLATKVRACKGVGQERAQESHFMFPGVQENVKEWTSKWTPILGIEVPMES
jgi:hypothetical protein